jgi:hypothetical protein
MHTLLMTRPAAPLAEGQTIGVRMPAITALKEAAAEMSVREGKWQRPWTGAVRPAGEPLTTTDVCHEIVKPLTEQWRCALWQLVPAALRGPVTAYLSHAWQMDYVDVHEAAQHTLSSDPDASIFFCLFVNNQWAAERDLTFAEMELTFRASLEYDRPRLS